ncbi:hypothetical protein D3C80_208820 [compost metagenome]
MIKKQQSMPEYNFLLGLYVFFNIVCAIYFSSTGLLGGDFGGEYKASSFWIVIALCIILLTFILFPSVIFNFFNSIKVNRCKNIKSNSIDYFFTLVFIFSIYIAVVYKMGVYGMGEDIFDSIPSYINVAYSILQVPHLGLIYFFYRVEGFREITFLINLVFYISLCLISGQTFQLVFILILYLLWRREVSNPVNMKGVIFFSVFGLLLYPFIRLLKLVLVIYQRDAIEAAVVAGNIINDFSGYYVSSVFDSLERFQIVANLSFILERFEYLSSDYQRLVGYGDVNNFFSSNWVFKFFIKTFGFFADLSDLPQKYLALFINGNDFWTSHISLFGYYVFYGFASLFIYVFVLLSLFTGTYFCKKISNKNNVQLLNRIMILTMICHGWFMAYVGFIQALFLFYFLLYFFDALNKLIRFCTTTTRVF